jgi:hypothetical protein
MATLITREDFDCEANTKRMVLFSNPELLIAMRRFLDSFELVFGETDWEQTREAIGGDLAKYFIHPNGNFLEPGVDDESNNWWNRGSLLADYRRIKHQLSLSQFIVSEIRPCGSLKRLTNELSVDDIDDAPGVV